MIIPKMYSGQDVSAIEGIYKCPLCPQSVLDEADTGWVSCPMLEDQFICFGDCLDHQYCARSIDFDKHPYRPLFDILEVMVGKTPEMLRKTCLRHQREILMEKLSRGVDSIDEKKMLSHIEQLINE